jgi:hypothetical protein
LQRNLAVDARVHALRVLIYSGFRFVFQQLVRAAHVFLHAPKVIRAHGETGDRRETHTGERVKTDHGTDRRVTLHRHLRARDQHDQRPARLCGGEHAVPQRAATTPIRSRFHALIEQPFPRRGQPVGADHLHIGNAAERLGGERVEA